MTISYPDPEPLPSQINTPAVHDEVLALAEMKLEIPFRNLEVFFRSGQWFVMQFPEGKIWRVADVRLPDQQTGRFDFVCWNRY